MIDDALAAALTLIELRETRLLSRGIHDGCLAREEILETLREGEVSDPATVLDKLIARSAIVETPTGAFRSRMAEAVHMMATARQWFPGRSSWDAAGLVVDYRLLHTPRRRPVLSRAVGEVVEVAGKRLNGSGNAVISTICKPTVSGFQLDSTAAVLDGLRDTKDRGVVISAGTGSGKTLAFYLPALSWIVDSLDHETTPFVKALAIYPRNELLKDQLQTAVGHALSLRGAGVGARPMRLGTWFGVTPGASYWLQQGWTSWEIVGQRQQPDGWICPFISCPADNCEGQMIWLAGDVGAKRERLSCSECALALDGDILCLTRESAKKRPPDVMFTTTESLNRQLSAPDTHRAFGLAGSQGVRMVLLDEVHTYEGTTGAQNAYLLRRLRQKIENDSVLFAGLSATLLRAQEFFAQFTGLPEASIDVIEPNEDEFEETGAEYQLALRHNPASQTGPLSATIQAVMALQRTLDVSDSARSDNPFAPVSSAARSAGLFGSRTFVFTDKLDVTNRLFWDLLDAEGWWDDKGRQKERVPQTLAHLRSENQSRLRETQREEVAARVDDGQYWWLAEHLGHGLERDRQLDVGRTSSQDQGVGDADVVVATATLEVGYDDDRVGAVLQHKAPHNAARFLQRKGRAGRTILMRPWTVVVLSDFGRDRLAFESYDQLFNPQLEATRLPLGNLYVLKMQAVYAMLDWLSARIVEKKPNRNVWADLAGPARAVESNESRAEARASRQRRAEEVLRGVLYGGPERGSLTRHLRQALKITDREIDAILWGAPRSLLLTVVPTALRRLESQWEGEEPTPGDTWLKTRTPLREFVAGNLFDDLLVSDVCLVLPAEGRYQDPREEGLSISRVLQEFLPGNVSRHFGVDSFGRRHWVPVPEDGNLAIDQYSGRFIREVEDGEGHSLRVYEPQRIELSVPPDTVMDSTSSGPTWEVELEAVGHGNHVQLPNAWKNFLPELRFRMHADGDAVRVTRFSRSSTGTIRTREGTSATACAFRDDGGAVALGYELEADAIDFDIVLPALAPITFLERSLRLRALVDQHPQTAAFHHLQRSALTQAVLLCIADHGSGATILGWTNRDFASSMREALIRLGMNVTEIPPGPDEEAGEEHDPTEQLNNLDDAIGSDEVLDGLKLMVQAVLGDRDDDWESWQRRRIAVAAASMILDAASRLVPVIDAEQFTVDVTQPKPETCQVWLCESGPGGNGLVQSLYSALADSTVEFRRLINASLEPGGLDALALELDGLLNAPTKELANAVEGIRLAWPSGHQAVEDAVEKLRETVPSASQESIAALTARLASPGASPGLAVVSGRLLDRWEKIEASSGFAIDVRTFASTVGTDQTLDDELGLQKSPDATIRSSAVSRLMWPRSLSLAGAEDRGRTFGERLPADVAALAAYVPAPWKTIECTSVEEARAAVRQHLPTDGAASLRFDDAEIAKQASTFLVGEPVEVDALLVFPKIISATLSPSIKLVLAAMELSE